MLPQSFEVNCHELKFAIYIEILVLTIFVPKDQKEAIHNFLPINGRSNGGVE